MKKNWLKGGMGLFVLAGTAAMIPAPAAKATLWTIGDNNSYADFDSGSQSGMYNWVVDGVDNMFQQWFWYRTDGMNQEASLDTLTIDVEGVTDTDFDTVNDTLFIRYDVLGINQNLLAQIELRFTIHGGSNGSGTSDIAEQIAIYNRSGEDLGMSIFQYNDADLNGGSTDTGVNIFNTPSGSAARQQDAGSVLHETVVTPRPAHHEANTFPNTLASLNDGAVTTLNDNNSLIGPNDYTWAFQWDFVLDGREGTFIISKDKQIAAVPAPGALLLGAMGMSLVGWMKRRKAC